MTGLRPLHHAAAAGDLAAVRRLLDHGVDVDVRDDEGRTPLQLAVGRGHEAVVEALLAGEAHAPDVLLLEAPPGLWPVLLEHGLDAEVTDERGDGLWMAARTPAAVRQVAALLPVPPPAARQRLLRAACHRPALLEALLLRFPPEAPPPDARGLHGLMAVHHAALWGAPGALSLLVAHGADLAVRTDKALVDGARVFPAGLTPRDLSPDEPLLEDAPHGAPVGHPVLLVSVGPYPESVRFKLEMELSAPPPLEPGAVLWEAPDPDAASVFAQSLRAAGAVVQVWHDAGKGRPGRQEH